MGFATVLLAAEQAPPLIDIDGTVFLQLAIFLVMLGVLSALLFRPYLAVRDGREKGIDGAQQDAKRMEERAAGLLADYETALSRAKARGAEQRAQLRNQSHGEERKLLDAARAASEQEIQRARSEIEGAEASARWAVLADAPALGQAIAARVLRRSL